MLKLGTSLLSFLLWFSFPAGAQYCRVRLSMLNMDRWVTSGSIHEECTGPIHTPPFGNWGVNSVWGYRSDGNQFTGWKGAGSDPNPEWNSCTDTYPWAPENRPVGEYYNEDLNSDGWGDTQSSSGTYPYAGSRVDFWTDCPKDTNYDGWCDAGGCIEMLNSPFGFGWEFLELYELDRPDSDDYVGTLYVDAEGYTVQFQNCGFGACYGPEYSSWRPTYPSDLGSAQVLMVLEEAEFIDEYDEYLQISYCQELASWDRLYQCQQ